MNIENRSTHPWIEKMRFEETSQKSLLQAVIDKVQQETKIKISNGGKDIKVVFDVDSTIFDVKPRTLRIIREFSSQADTNQFPEFIKWGMNLKSHQLAYTLHETAEQTNFPLDHPEARTYLKSLFHFWKDRFFTHEYVLSDHPAPGALEFLRKVQDAGAQIVYLTGRDKPGMGKGSESMLRHWGFPIDEPNAHLIMKPYFGMDDAEFKDLALAELRAHSEVIAIFDNEPANFHVFEKNFPDAFLVFYHSNCSTKEAPLIQKAYKILDFKMKE